MDKEAQAIYLMLKGLVSDMPANDQQAVHSAADELRAVVAKHGDHGTFAFSFLGAEMATKP